MYEGKPPNRVGSDPFDPGSSETGLTALSWSDLVVRLATAQYLRGASPHDGDGPAGSFDTFSAKRIAAHRDGKDGVNHDASVNGKQIAPKVGSTAAADPASRGNK